MSGLQAEARVTGSVDGLEPHAGPPRPAIRPLLVSASRTVVLQGASLLIGFATSVLLARLLGGDDYGRYVFALAWVGLLMIPAILGLDRFLVRGIARYEVEQHWALIRGLLRRANQFVLLISVGITVIGWVVAAVWLPSSLRWPFSVAMLLIPITALTVLRQAAMQAIGRVVLGQLPEYLIRPVLILAIVCALRLAGGHALSSTTALGANVAGVAVAFIVGALLLRRSLPRVLRSIRPRYSTREWLRASLPMMLISGIWMANNYVTTLIVGTTDGPRAAGVYSVVQRGAELIVVLLLAANMPLAPTIARLHALGDTHGLEHAAQRVAQATLVVSIPIAAVFMIFPGVYLGLFGASFHVGATALSILAAGQLVNAAAGPAGNVLLMTGHERVAMRGIGAGLVANLVLGIVLVPPLGVTGGAIAFATSLALWNVSLVVSVRRRLGINVTALRRLAVHASQ